jgi:hypothetical protein
MSNEHQLELEQEREREEGAGNGKEAEKEDSQEENPDDMYEKAQEAGPTTSSQYNEEDSDLTIVSSDGTHFKVHSQIIRRAS